MMASIAERAENAATAQPHQKGRDADTRGRTGAGAALLATGAGLSLLQRQEQ